MKNKLIEAYQQFTNVSVKGEDVEKLYIGLTKLAGVIRSLPDAIPDKERRIQ